MFKKLAITVALLFATSCGDQVGTNTGKDGYKFEVKEYEKQTVTVTIQVFASQDALNKYAKDNKIDVQNLAAFAKLYPSQDKCTIFVVDPSAHYEPEFIGHEFVHCVWGRWHPKQDERR